MQELGRSICAQISTAFSTAQNFDRYADATSLRDFEYSSLMCVKS
jgi:hypothetical protein